MIACLIACCIPAGSIAEQLNTVAMLTDVQVLYDFAELPGDGAAVCGHTADELLDQILSPHGIYWYWINERRIEVVPEPPTCMPERGADAPVPPCQPRITI